MPDVNLEIGGRTFTVSCATGEEPQLRKAALVLDQQAQVVGGGGSSRQPDAKLLLLSGLMLADRSIEMAERLENVETEIAALRQAAEDAEARAEAAAREAAAARDARAEDSAEGQGALDLLDRMTAKLEGLAGSR